MYLFLFPTHLPWSNFQMFCSWKQKWNKLRILHLFHPYIWQLPYTRSLQFTFASLVLMAAPKRIFPVFALQINLSYKKLLSYISYRKLLSLHQDNSQVPTHLIHQPILGEGCWDGTSQFLLWLCFPPPFCNIGTFLYHSFIPPKPKSRKVYKEGHTLVLVPAVVLFCFVVREEMKKEPKERHLSEIPITTNLVTR